MQSPCYRCGTPVEEQTAFCPSCGAPQIKVSVPAESATQASDAQLSPGAPDLVPPPSIAATLGSPGKIQWKSYRRIAIPLSVIAGIAIAFIAPIGLVTFFAAIIYSVNRYRRVHPGQLSPSQGARLGAFHGLISFAVATVIQISLLNQGEFRRQMTLEVQRRFAGNPDPQVQQLVQWAETNQGFLVITALGMLFMLAVFLIVASLAGALTVTLWGRKDRA
jgi:hypothetical protein